MLSREKEVGQNLTTISEFILLGFGDLPKLQIFLFLLFLVIYLLTMAGNLLIVMLVVSDKHLHTPMYFFLGNLSFLESCYSTTILPKMLSSFLTGEKSIYIRACFVQFFIFSCLGGTECYLLAVMSYDRYLAICKPLHYAALMSGRLSFQLAAVSWFSGVLVGTSLTLAVSWLSFCGPNEIDDYFCDVSSNIRYISCSDTHLFELSGFIFTSIFTMPPLVLTVASYVFIIHTVLRIPSTTGRQKAFSTCSSHLIVVSLFYGSLMFVYMLPRTKNLRHIKKVFSLFYTVLTPLVNPLIYSLRNKEVKGAMKKGFRKCTVFITL
ncbi:olfactory receptor 2AP1-like [Hemicordylus capensis]|uniref:olfactory receptor 2AP1-like n=1 Tax=Hemicordylus capensis TaxID=884348 RepID=UPI0023027A56|nr:olfactory receptor 2AP1-like [Hemicordylus capensis]